MNNKAKQFMPFDALKGLKDELKAKEKIKVDKPCLDEEVIQELSNKLIGFKKRDNISLDYFSNYQIIHLEGMIDKIEKELGYLIVDSKKINFVDLIKIY